jgi:MFS family permease
MVYTRTLMSSSRSPLFTPHFFLMCGFSFTVFMSAFQLFPTAPFRILELGGTNAHAGMFLGLLTYSSAFSAPFTGALADRLGRARMLVGCSLVIAAFAIAYAFATSYHVLLVLVVGQGIFWSGLLSASAAYVLGIIPEERRAEGIGYWGLSTIFAVAFAPSIGLWIYRRGGWPMVCASIGLLNLMMAAIAMRLPDAIQQHGVRTLLRRLSDRGVPSLSSFLEWRVLVMSFTLFLYAFGYGAITSFAALYATARGAPAGLYFTVLAVAIVSTRPFSAPLADRIGHKKVLVPCLSLLVLGLGLLAQGGEPRWLVASAIAFGCGFGSAYPVYAAYVTRHVIPSRRGAAFGSIIAAMDTGIGTGSMTAGWIIEHGTFERAFGVAAAVAALSIPYFLVMDRLVQHGDTGP